MKKLSFLLAAVFLLLLTAQARTPQKGAPKVQELSQAIYNAIRQNQFDNINPYIPGDTELKILKRRSSEDMRLILERTTPDSLRNNLQRDLSTIIEQSTSRMLNWTEWQLADTRLSRRDKKNPLLYRAEMHLTNAAGAESIILFEAVRIRGRFYLFKQMVLQTEK